MSVPPPSPRFIIQKHDSKSPHFDFRLERDGVFKSWAIPKGLPNSAGIRRLALVTVDHDMSFGDFEGEIPDGKPGAGMISLRDHGTYDIIQWNDEHLEFILHGRLFSGHYHMVKFPRAGHREWLIFMMDG